jgi:hypothetical protein
MVWTAERGRSSAQARIRDAPRSRPMHVGLCACRALLQVLVAMMFVCAPHTTATRLSTSGHRPAPTPGSKLTLHGALSSSIAAHSRTSPPPSSHLSLQATLYPPATHAMKSMVMGAIRTHCERCSTREATVGLANDKNEWTARLCRSCAITDADAAISLRGRCSSCSRLAFFGPRSFPAGAAPSAGRRAPRGRSAAIHCGEHRQAPVPGATAARPPACATLAGLREGRSVSD